MSVLSKMLLPAVSVLGTATLTQATLITSYENADAPSGTSYSTSVGVTHGLSSLAVSTPAAWTDTIIYQGTGAAATLQANPLLSVDVTAPVVSTEGSWLNFQLVIQGDGLGWTLSPLLWNASPAALNQTTLTWDVSSIAIPANPSWFQIEIVSQGDVARTLYFDNLRAVPEPAGLASLGMALMAGLGMRRRKNTL